MNTDSASQIITEHGEGKCWHKCNGGFLLQSPDVAKVCIYCGLKHSVGQALTNPDFADWDNFGRLVTVAHNNKINIVLEIDAKGIRLTVGDTVYTRCQSVDKIPQSAMFEIARVLIRKIVPLNKVS